MSNYDLLSKICNFTSGNPVEGLFEPLAALRSVAHSRLWELYWEAWHRVDEASNLWLQQWHNLPPPAQARLTCAPEVFALLNGAGYGRRGYDLRLMAGWIRAELAAHSNTLQNTGWTALGDIENGETRGRFSSIGPLIDWQSPAAVLPLNEIPGNAVHASKEQGLTIEANIETGLLLLAATAPIWGEAVHNFVAVVAARNDTQCHSVRSSSTRLAIGRIVVHNAHFAEVTPALLAEAILHETVHTLLDLAEIACPLVEKGAHSIMTASPWTGKPLDLNTFVHACFVWRSLFELWVRLLAQGSVPPERAISRMATCARGFLETPSPVDRLKSGVSSLVRDHIASLTATVTEAL